MINGLLMLLAALVPAGDAAGAPQSPEPEWVQKPRGEDYARFFPPSARELGVSGRVVLQCTPQRDGSLKDCAVVEETPKGWGFGGAGLRMAAKFRMTPRSAAAQTAVGQPVSIPIQMIAPLKTVLLCTDAPPETRVCEVDDDNTRGAAIWRGADALALQRIAQSEPPADARTPAGNGRYRVTVTVPMPIQDCPTFNGQPKCDGATRFLPLKQ